MEGMGVSFKVGMVGIAGWKRENSKSDRDNFASPCGVHGSGAASLPLPISQTAKRAGYGVTKGSFYRSRLPTAGTAEDVLS